MKPRIQLVIGAVLVVAAIAVDPLRGRPVQPGAMRIVVVIFGLFMVALALGAERPRLRRATVGLLALTTLGYACLLAIELVLWLMAPRQPTRVLLEDMRGRTVEDPHVGFRSTPNWVGMHDDGIVQAEYRHNDRGDRDDDAPVAGAARKILLLGDSFTYGQTLARAQTIEARIEAHAAGTVDAYNLGVPGYAAIHSLRRFEQSDWWRGDDVVYLFFNNDIHTASRAWDYIRVYDDYPVPRRAPDGTAHTDQELDQRLRAALAADPTSFRAKLDAAIGLTRLGNTLAAMTDRELRLTGMPMAALDPTVVEEAVRDSLAMRARAESIGARFHLVVLPAPMEGVAREWSTGTGSFVTAARAAGLAPVEDLLREVELFDYVAHDGHFSPSGADKAAQLVLRLGPQ